MKRHTLMLVIAGILVSTTARAQERGNPGGAPAGNSGVLSLFSLLEAAQQGQQTSPPAAGQRGGARGAADPNALEAYFANVGTGRRLINTDGALFVVLTGAGGAWWANEAIRTRLAVTDDQKLKLEQAFERNRQSLTTTKDALEREESQLARLLDVDQVDRGAVTSQIYKVVQARGEMERVNSLMTLEMREVLTRAQWTQLQGLQTGTRGGYVITQPAPAAGQRSNGTRSQQ
jgi:Spy/CpxP family protein refolding chaperone